MSNVYAWARCAVVDGVFGLVTHGWDHDDEEFVIKTEIRTTAGEVFAINVGRDGGWTQAEFDAFDIDDVIRGVISTACSMGFEPAVIPEVAP